MGRLTNPEPWRRSLPGEVLAAVEGWIRDQAFDVTHRRWLAGGASDSYVAVIRKRLERGGVRGAILKILPPHIAAHESRGVTSAEQHTPDAFYARHLVPTTSVSALALAGWWLHLQEVAQVDVALLLPLSAVVDDGAFGGYCGTIVSSIVREWNPCNSHPRSAVYAPAAFLADFLSPHQAGLKEFALAGGIADDPPTDEILVVGRSDLLPNPLALLAGKLAADELEIFLGNTHGDLHLDNILVPVEEHVNAAAYRLVGVGRFSLNGPVSRDPMKLLLSVASFWLPSLAAHSAIRSSLAELVVQPAAVSKAAPTAGYLAVARQIHLAAALWGTQRRLAAEWHRQNLLVLIGSALRNVAHRTLPMADRWWYFEVAALAARAFVEPSAHPGTPPTIARPVRNGASALAERSGPRPVGAVALDSIRPINAYPAPRRGIPGGWIKVEFCRRLGASSGELADMLQIPNYELRRFPAGEEARSIWGWLEVRARLEDLPSALIAVDRRDLAELLDVAEPEAAMGRHHRPAST